MNALELLLCGLSAVALLPAGVLSVQVLMALPRARLLQELPVGRRPRIAVLVPAHDEAMAITATLSLILPQLENGDRLLVVADNCSDETANSALSAGAEVVERLDREQRGKGYALDFGVRHLANNPPEILIMVDADCAVAAGSIDRLARTSLALGQPVQALDLMRSPAEADLKTRIAEFAWVVKNQVRPLGCLRLGWPCQLMGTGMAFPWEIISKASLASGHIVEDMKLGIDLAIAGHMTRFCPEALVTSAFPSSATAIRSQRTRWEHGHLEMILGNMPRLMQEAVRQRNRSLMALALDLSVPPLALLGMLVSALLAVDVTFGLLAQRLLPVLLGATAFAMLGITLFLAWWFFGRQILSPANLACAPFYALGKIPLYLKFVIGRQVEWVRSARDGK